MVEKNKRGTCVGECKRADVLIASKGLCWKCYAAGRRTSKPRRPGEKRGRPKKGIGGPSRKKAPVPGMSCQECGAEIDKLLEQYSMMILRLLGIAEDYKEDFDRLRAEFLKARQTKLEGMKEKVAKELQPVRVFIHQTEKDEKAKGT